MKDIITEKQIVEKPIIEVKSIGKKYNITHERGRYVALRDVITNVAKSPFSFLKQKAKSAVGLEKKEEFWALKGVDFSIKKGEVVGIIGNNGAGKSTLLKILTQITPPTEGEIILRGRVASLLEVGTGFHPELTGRENIILNGSILGMKRKEIERKFDEIVDFAGIEKFLDTPVKRYSSGMYVRLAFSVAAHMEPDILLVDEVLAVGDAEFQKKCLGKMEDVTRSEHRTILFVSHNMDAVRSLCTRTILLNKGQVVAMGETDEVVDKYLNNAKNEIVDLAKHKRRGDGRIRLTSFHMEDDEGKKITSVESGKDIVFVASYSCAKPEEIEKVDVGFSINRNGSLLSKFYSSYMNHYYSKIYRTGEFRLKIKNIPLNSGTYGIAARLIADGIEADWPKDEVASLDVNNVDFYGQPKVASNDSILLLKGNWS